MHILVYYTTIFQLHAVVASSVLSSLESRSCPLEPPLLFQPRAMTLYQLEPFPIVGLDVLLVKAKVFQPKNNLGIRPRVHVEMKTERSAHHLFQDSQDKIHNLA